MFLVENNVPDVYVQESRDFQLFSRLYDLVFQSSRFSIDSIPYASDTMHCNDALLPLIATKVGFFTDVNLTNYSHRKVLSAFPYIINYKGSIKGLTLVVNLLGCLLNTKVFVEQSQEDPNKVVVYFEKYSPDFDLLNDILNYMRPTGCLIEYRVVTSVPLATDFIVSDTSKLETQLNNNDIPFVVHKSSEDNSILPFATAIGFTEISNKISEELEKDNE